MLFTTPNNVPGKRRARFRCFFVLSLATIALLGLGSGLHPRDNSQDPIVSIAQLPASIDAVVVIEEAASLRAFDSGGAIIGALVETGLLTRTTRSWEELASSLDWTPGEAFDELFGRRVVLVFDEIQNTSGPRWVVVADVDVRTQARIRKKLKLAPRTVANSARVLAGERGRFRLAVIPGQPGTDVSSLLIAPVEHKAFFFQTLKALTDPDADIARFGDTRGYHQLQRLERRTLSVVVQPASDAGESDSFIALSARCAGTDWIAHWFGSLSLLGISPEVAQALDAWPCQAFESVSQDALLAVMGVTGRVQTDTLGSLGRFATSLLNVGGAASAFSDAGPVQMFAIHRTARASSADADVGSTSQIDLIIAAQSAQPGDPAAIDKALAKFIAGVSKPASQSKLDLSGAFPYAIRSVKIDPGGQPTFAWLHAQGEDITISWSQTRPPDETSGETDGKAWWIVQISGSQSAQALGGRLNAVAFALASGTSTPPSAKRVSMGVVRPCELVDWLTDLGMDATGELVMFRDIEKLRWDAWITDEQLIEGEARLTVRPRARPLR